MRSAKTKLPPDKDGRAIQLQASGYCAQKGSAKGVHFRTVVGDALLAAGQATAKSMKLKVDIDDHAAPNLCFEDASGNIRHLS
jgi:hypothetical protein